jgi:Bacterial protein of unknown function (DUF885)
VTLRALLVVFVVAPLSAEAKRATHQELVTLFTEWRTFQRPPRVDGVPDYGAKAMTAQAKALPGWLAKLSALETTDFTLAQKNDVKVVRAEMMGLDFDHRVLSPWTRDPSFYVSVFAEQSDQPAREGKNADAAVELWQLTFPLTAERTAALTTQLLVVPKLLTQARKNLIGNGKDLWAFAPNLIREQSAALKDLATKVTDPACLSAIAAAREATDAYATWVDAQAKTKTGKSGVGVEQYNWYLANVMLTPFTWAELVTLMERELARAKAGLALEELHNRALPELAPATTVAEHQRRFDDAVKTWVGFLRKNDFITWQPWMEPALSVLPGAFNPTPPLEFFTEVEARDPMLLRLHMWHFLDLAALEKLPNTSPIRQQPALSNLFNTRTEGFATAVEELMMHAGLFDGRPRSRELVYVMLAQRAARALGDLKMHANEWSLEEAAAFASKSTPRGWLRLSGHTVRGEQHLFLRQPTYGTSYIVGKVLLDQLLARRTNDGPLAMKRLLDGLLATGLIPMALVVQELEPSL